MTTLYRLYTEYRANLDTLASAHFKGFTVFEGAGYWSGLAERAAVVEILTDDSAEQRALVYTLAEDIRAVNTQTTVIVTEQQVDTVLITAKEDIVLTELAS